MSTMSTQQPATSWIREAVAFSTVAGIVLGIAVCPHFSSARADAGRGPVVALGFNEPAGATAYDQSGARNTGTIVGATRVAGQEGFGGALWFDGANDLVALAASDSLNPAAVTTVEAWVKPVVPGRTAGVPVLPLNRWSHVATISDGARMRLYVDGTERSSEAASAVASSWAPLRIDGNDPAAPFAGLIDDVRVYTRALSTAEIRDDMATPIP
jgi:hypothetical protein